MPRYYVQKGDEWNVFSTIVDEFLYTDFMTFEELKALVVGETVIDKLKDIETLKTEYPKLNKMPYETAIEIIKRQHPEGSSE